MRVGHTQRWNDGTQLPEPKSRKALWFPPAPSSWIAGSGGPRLPCREGTQTAHGEARTGRTQGPSSTLVSHGNGHACICPLSQLVLNPRKVPGTVQGSGHTGESKQTSTLNEAPYHSLLERAGILRTPGPLHMTFPTSVEIAPTLSPISGRGKLLVTL